MLDPIWSLLIPLDYCPHKQGILENGLCGQCPSGQGILQTGLCGVCLNGEGIDEMCAES